MKTHLSPVLFAPLLGLSAPALAQETATDTALPQGAPEAMRFVDAKDLMRHAMWLADDARGGRLTGSAGQEEAARYIADHFESLGLEPMGDLDGDTGKRSYFQRYALERRSLGDGAMLTVGEDQWADGFAVLGGKDGKLDIEGKLHFLGQGRTRGTKPEVPQDFDMDGVIPVIIPKVPRGQPPANMGIEQKFMASFQGLGQLMRNVTALGRKGAKVVLVMLPEDRLGLMDVLNTLSVAPGKDMMAAGDWKGGMDQMAMMARMLGGGPNGVPVVFLSPERSDAMVQAMGGDAGELVKYFRREQEAPETKPVDGGISLELTTDREATACNVVAVLRGSDDSLAEEAIVYSAHMDHVGMRMDGDVFNGADDNASGSAGLLDIAQAYSKLETAPRRSVIFLSVSGEELGLWGSEYYSKYPTWPLEKIVADVNTDMIGRSGPESDETQVTVTPSYMHPHFSSMVQEAARIGEIMGMTFESGDKYYERSDHYNFAKNGIPVVFFCNGEHEDYHQVSDHPDKLDAQKMEAIARIAFWTGWTVANADEAPEKLGRSDAWK